jgi:TPR repeat protein
MCSSGRSRAARGRAAEHGVRTHDPRFIASTQRTLTVRLTSPWAAAYAEPIRAAERLFWKGHLREAFEEYLVLAEKGIAECQVFVGWMYETGKGTGRDVAEARKWYGRAALSGLPSATFRLGVSHQASGDIEQALKYLREAAQLGHGSALSRLGTMHLVGNGVPVDLAEAKKLFRMALQAGSYIAGLRLGLMLMRGAEGAAGRFKGLGLYMKCGYRGILAAMRNPSSDSITD